MDLKLPNLGEGADSGVVVNLFVKPGDVIERDQPVLELENEKAMVTIPSTAAGVVTQVYVQPGDRVLVGQRILALTAAGKPDPAGPVAEPPSVAAAPVSAPARPVPASPSTPPALEVGSQEVVPSRPGQEPAAAPSIRHLARELGIDLAQVPGSQRGGRIVMSDLRAYVQRLQRLAAQSPTAAPPAQKPAAEAVDFSKWGPVSIKPLPALRQAISRRMHESWSSVPRVTQFDEADITELMALRAKYAPVYADRGARLTLTGFVLQAVAAMLRKHPVFNTSLAATSANLVFKAYYHLGVAVDTEAGLLVPVIRDVDMKTLVELSRELDTLAQKARERKLSADEMKGGTFTISNQGGIGSGHFTPMVNQPEVAILGVGRGALKPVWRQERVEPRTLLPLALSYDHRVIDGGSAARFMVDLVQALEHPEEAAVKL